MKNNFDINNELLLERAKELALKKRAETVRPFLRRPSSFFTFDHILFYIAAVANILLYLINFFACQQALLLNSDTVDVAKKTMFRNTSVFSAVLLGAAIIVIAYRLFKDKCYIISAAISFVAIFPMTFMFVLGVNPVELRMNPMKFVPLYFGPALLICLALIHIMIIIISEKRAIKKKYNDIITAIYEQNKDTESGMMSTEDWEKAIAAYIENPNGKEKLKKSLRKKSH